MGAVGVRLVWGENQELRNPCAGRHGRHGDGRLWWQDEGLFGLLEGAGLFLVREKAVGGRIAYN